VTCLLFALKALSEDEILYGVYATPEQVNILKNDLIKSGSE